MSKNRLATVIVFGITIVGGYKLLDAHRPHSSNIPINTVNEITEKKSQVFTLIGSYEGSKKLENGNYEIKVNGKEYIVDGDLPLGLNLNDIITANIKDNKVFDITSNRIEKIKLSLLKWIISESTDPMTNSKSYYLIGDNKKSITYLHSPYSNTESWIGVGCNDDNQWAFFGFSNSPNLTNDITKDGYNLIKARVNFDGKLDRITLIQEWGDKFLQPRHDQWLINHLKNTKTVKLELDWYGNNSTIFQYDTLGFASKYSEFLKKCNGLKKS